jgi:hypothetical protein
MLLVKRSVSERGIKVLGAFLPSLHRHTTEVYWCRGADILMKPSGLRRFHIYEYLVSGRVLAFLGNLANQFRESPCALQIVYYLRKMLTFCLRSLSNDST